MKKHKLESEVIAKEIATKDAKTKAIELKNVEKEITISTVPFNKTKGIVKLDKLKKGESFCFRLNRNEYYVYMGKSKGKFSYAHKNRLEKLFFENKNVFVVKDK